MKETRSDHTEQNACILYWGVPHAGITSNLQTIHAKLKADNRGDLRRVPTRIDPTIEYEVLPIELGIVGGIKTHLHIIGVPSAPEQSPTRKHLLDRIDGIVFVVDSQPERLQENLLCLKELRESLADYGESLEALPFVVQYNKCDLVDPYGIEQLHRELELPHAAVFEASARDGTNVLKTLTTISKQVVRMLGRRNEDAGGVVTSALPHQIIQEPVAPPPARERAEPVMPPPTLEPVAVEPDPPASPAGAFASPAPSAHASSQDLMEAAILAEAEDDLEAEAAGSAAFEAQTLLDQTWDSLSNEMKPQSGARIGHDLKIVSVGVAERNGDLGVRIPLVLGNEDGETVTMALSLQLETLLDGEP